MAHDVFAGLRSASRDGTPARWITLTDPSRQPMHLEAFNRAFARFTTTLARHGDKWDHYIATLGVGASGRLHRHVVALGGPFVHWSVLNEYANRCHLGHVDVSIITPTEADHRRVATYVAFNAVVFAESHRLSARRVQPVTRSKTRTTPTTRKASSV